MFNIFNGAAVGIFTVVNTAIHCTC